MDITYAFVFHGLRGIPPGRILQSVASGLLGMNSFRLGLTSICLGIFLQFFIALGFASIYCLLSKRLKLLRERAVLFGLGYGVAIYYFMNLVVVPSSRAPKFKSSALSTVTGLAVHMLFIGLPIALSARAFLNGNADEQRKLPTLERIAMEE